MGKNKNFKIYNIFIFFAFLLAIIFGIYMPDFIDSISFIGNIYINLLKFMILPIIFTSILVTTYKTKKNKEKLLGKTIILFIIMFILTFLITSLIVYIIKPGYNFNLIDKEWTGQIEEIDIKNIFINIFPNNIITMFQNNSIFSTIIFAFVFGLSATKVENSEKIIDFFDIIKNIFYRILNYIMYLTPLAVFSLVGGMISSYKLEVLKYGFKYILTAYLCSVVILIFVMMLPICIIRKISPLKYIKKISKVFLMTITTCSSVATLPTTIKTCKNEFNIRSSTTDIVVPLGCTIHMCGGAVSFSLLALFCSQYLKIDINLTTYLIMVISATLINMAAPGIPGGGIIIGATYLSILNMPLSFIGFYSGIYKLLDMSYTTLNVFGDITANIIIDELELKNNN